MITASLIWALGDNGIWREVNQEIREALLGIRELSLTIKTDLDESVVPAVQAQIAGMQAASDWDAWTSSQASFWPRGFFGIPETDVVVRSRLVVDRLASCLSRVQFLMNDLTYIIPAGLLL